MEVAALVGGYRLARNRGEGLHDGHVLLHGLVDGVSGGEVVDDTAY